MKNNRPHLSLIDLRPIETRTYTAGGSGTFLRDDYGKHANKIFKEAQELKNIFEGFKDSEEINRRYFRVELADEHNVLSTDGKKLENNILGSFMGSPNQKVAHFSTLESSFDILVEQLKNYTDSKNHEGKSKFAPIENIRKIPASEKITQHLAELLKSGDYKGEVLLTLFPDLSREEIEVLKKSFQLYLGERNGEIISETTTNFGKVLRIRAKLEDLNKLADSFLSIQTLDPVEEVFVESATTGQHIEDTVIVNTNISTAKVCIFDSGVARNSRFLDGSIIEQEEPIGPPYDVSHGTFVASRIIFGNSLRDDISKGVLNPDVKVLSVCMTSYTEIGNPKPAKGEEFLKIVRDTVERWHQEIKVYNLSMNLVFQNTSKGILVADDHVGGLAAEIDYLSKKYGILFILTTGNYPLTTKNTALPVEPFPEYFKNPETRICTPGEAMLALTVGSIADRENRGSMVKVNHPSPFTRRGPGFNGYRKPDLVAQGGNYAADWRSFEDLSVVGIDRNGAHLAYGNGTSYSAPLISRTAAQLFAVIPSATSELVRALLIHSAVFPLSEGIEEKIFSHLTGNGIPNSQSLLTSNRWNQVYIYQGMVEHRKIIKIPFYVPRVLLDRKARNKVRIRFTLVFSPETNRTLKSGYCKSHLRTQISKLDKQGNLKSASTGDSNETIQNRYSTIIRYDKVFSSGVSSGEWQLLVEHQSRWTVQDKNIPFTVVLSVCDPMHSEDIDIYNAIQTEMPLKYQDFVSIREKVRI